MAEPDTDLQPTIAPFDLPIQPTGSGVADLEIMREQDAVLDGEAADDPNRTFDGPVVDKSEIQPS